MENFGILTPGDLNFDPEPKNDRNDIEMIFRELSNAVFGFVLRCAGAEIDGGGVFKHPPPPPAGGGKSRGPAVRGLTRALERVLRITPSGGTYNVPPSISVPIRAAVTIFFFWGGRYLGPL